MCLGRVARIRPSRPRITAYRHARSRPWSLLVPCAVGGARAGRERQGLLAAELLLQLPKLVFVSFDGNVELVVGARPKEAVDAHIEANHGKDIRPVSQSAWKAMLLGNYGGLLEASGCERWPGVVEG